MPSLADTIRQLRAAPMGAPAGGTAAASRLSPLSDFGTNPGALDGWFYAPDGAIDLPLVVVLHGCTQTAAGYDRCSGWSDLAEQYGFAVLLPEQRRDNNPNLCFNWFNPADTARGQGEVLSIRQMIGAVTDRCPIDPRRVFVTGLSAGGAMTAAMLATYPELFAGGSIIAGLPYGAASSVPQALERMRGQGLAEPQSAAATVERASSHRGPWPTVTVWHGTADHTVNIANADAVLGQWRTLHGAGPVPDRAETIDGHQHRVWRGRDGREAVEEYRIAGMGHGTPLKTRGPASCGAAGPHMLEAGISSTWVQAMRWNLLDAEAVAPRREQPVSSPVHDAPPPPSDGWKPGADLTATIEGALRSAGLMR
jgi:poly(hydroxyalkanoate) depolymerase family esterase